MTTELTYLTWVTVLTAVMWIPYILNMIAVRGLLDAVGYPENPLPMAAWAVRMKSAHANAVENLIIFLTLVLIAHVAGISNSATVLACQIYFWTRVAHYFCYGFAVPWARTLTFAVGFAAQMTIAWQILSYTAPPV